MGDTAKTYLLVDGENIDGVLGGVLGHKPKPNERPRWGALTAYIEKVWGAPVQALFFINATKDLPMSFVQALLAMDYRPIPLSGSVHEKVVDIAIIRTMAAIVEHGGDVILASHDADFVDGMQALADADRRVGVVGFNEVVSQGLRHVAGVELFDLETDVGAVEVSLPRVRVIPLSEYDPLPFL
jgi:uncharacterized protein